MARNAHHDHLRSVPLFADLGDHELDVVGGATTEIDLKAGHTLIREGEIAHEMFVLVSGELEVTRGGETVATIDAGGFAGEMALLTRARRDATVTARTDVTDLHLDGRSFGSVLDEAPEIAVKMLPIVAARVVDNSTHHQH
ncbi:MAG: cyclic nucleotide-binding domain-containing protein [Ilumatobacter sp.]